MALVNEKIRVLIADDHVTILEGLSAIINRQPDMLVVGEAANGREAVLLWKQYRPDISLIDLRMPFVDGNGVIEEVRKNDPGARFIVLTTFDTDEDIMRAMKVGAKGYLLKDARREEILDFIRRVHDGQTCISSAITSKLTVSLSNEDLTRRELDVIALMAEGNSNKKIGLKLFITETTVKSHVRSIFLKLNAASRTEAISIASKRGLIRI